MGYMWRVFERGRFWYLSGRINLNLLENGSYLFEKFMQNYFLVPKIDTILLQSKSNDFVAHVIKLNCCIKL